MMVALFPALIIIEDRETRVLETLRLSPLSFAEYLGAKSILLVDFGAVILAISTGILLGWNLSWSLWGVGFLAALPSALLLIVLVAALAKNQMMAMSVIRPLVIFVILLFVWLKGADGSCLKRCFGKLPKPARESLTRTGSKLVLKWDLWHGGEAAVQARIRARTVDAGDISMMDNPFARRREGGGGGDDMASTLSTSGSVEMVAMDVEGGAKD